MRRGLAGYLTLYIDRCPWYSSVPPAGSIEWIEWKEPSPAACSRYHSERDGAEDKKVEKNTLPGKDTLLDYSTVPGKEPGIKFCGIIQVVLFSSLVVYC